MKIFNKKSEEEKVEEEIISMVNEGNEQGLIEDSEAQFITNIFEFTDKESRDVMTARLNVMAIDKNSDLDEVMEIMIENICAIRRNHWLRSWLRLHLYILRTT